MSPKQLWDILSSHNTLISTQKNTPVMDPYPYPYPYPKTFVSEQKTQLTSTNLKSEGEIVSSPSDQDLGAYPKGRTVSSLTDEEERDSFQGLNKHCLLLCQLYRIAQACKQVIYINVYTIFLHICMYYTCIYVQIQVHTLTYLLADRPIQKNLTIVLIINAYLKSYLLISLEMMHSKPSSL
jgi:hypothetical protein